MKEYPDHPKRSPNTLKNRQLYIVKEYNVGPELMNLEIAVFYGFFPASAHTSRALYTSKKIILKGESLHGRANLHASNSVF